MVFKIEFGKDFEKKYTKLVKKNKSLKKRIDKAVSLLAQNPKYPSLRSHIIQDTKYGQVWSSWAAPDLRIFWNYLDKEIIILLLDIDDHDHIY